MNDEHSFISELFLCSMILNNASLITGCMDNGQKGYARQLEKNKMIFG